MSEFTMSTKFTPLEWKKHPVKNIIEVTFAVERGTPEYETIKKSIIDVIGLSLVVVDENNIIQDLRPMNLSVIYTKDEDIK